MTPEDDRKRYLAIQAVRYMRAYGDNDIYYDGTQCDGWCLADDITAEWDLSHEEIREHSGLQARLKGRGC